MVTTPLLTGNRLIPLHLYKTCTVHNDRIVETVEKNEGKIGPRAPGVPRLSLMNFNKPVPRTPRVYPDTSTIFRIESKEENRGPFVRLHVSRRRVVVSPILNTKHGL